MLNNITKLVFVFFTSFSMAQTGHLMQGVGAVNMSMGGAATAQPLDISGAMQWNPAALSNFNGSILKLDVGAFFSSPELYSSLPEGAMWSEGDFGPGSPASPPVFGSIEDDLGASIMPALGLAWGKEESKHTYGVSVFGISGFGTDFPQETNLPMNPDGSPNANWDPNNSSPISYPQSLMGFGHVESQYMLLQIGFTWAYNINEKFSIGLQPTFNYGMLELSPNPLVNPNASGYPKSDQSTAVGFGGQLGIFYDSQNGFKLGASYKTPQYFGEFNFDSTYLDGSEDSNTSFTMNYPAIYSIGAGYSKGYFDLALDYRLVDYEGTDGFQESGWTKFASVKGFGWENISIISAGVQFKKFEKLPLRIGYTYSSNPINEELTFFSVPATAIIAHAFQFGLSYNFSERIGADAVYHYGMSDGKTTGQLLNPAMIAPNNILGKIPGSEVSYDMTTSMIMVGLNFRL